MTMPLHQILCQKIISGGQTGVDRGALDACLALKFDCGGFCPKNRKAEDGIIPVKYPLTETEQTQYSVRTEKNVIHSDGTLIIAPEKLTGGTLLTKELALKHNKTTFFVKPGEKKEPDNVHEILSWIKENSIQVLNVAGPRKSEWEMGFKFSYQLILSLIQEINNSGSILK